jgi:hypothetical protein
MRKQLITALMLGGLTMLVAGCTTYYRVTDPTSGKAYYTTKVSDTGRGGAVKVMDQKTLSMVTLQSSEVKEISEDEYKAGMAAKAPAKPTPVQPGSVQPTSVQPVAAQAAAPAQP